MSKTYIIGDIHGCYDELIALTNKIHLRPEDLLISLGDIVDRGGKSREVYQFFRNRPNSKVLMGNHERKHLNQVFSYAQEIVKVQFAEDYSGFLEWLSSLSYYHETPEAIIVHAAFEHSFPLEKQRGEVLCGSTAGDKHLEKIYTEARRWKEHYQGNKTIIYGHHVVGDKPEQYLNTLGIDTGACHGGYLTAIELPGFHIHQVKAEKDYWAEEQVIWQIPVLKAKDWDNMTFGSISKHLNKLAYIEVPEVRVFLSTLEQETNQLKAAWPELLTATATFVAKLVEIHGNDFVNHANQFPFKTMLFKSNNNNLKTEDLEKSLNTPAKVKAYMAAVKMP